MRQTSASGTYKTPPTNFTASIREGSSSLALSTTRAPQIPAHTTWCALNRKHCNMENSTSAEEECEATGPLLDPTAREFTPVWPLPPAPHLRSAALKPLLFPEPHGEDRSHLLRRSRDLPLPCVLCDRCFGESGSEGEEEEEGGRWERGRDALLCHFLDDHCIVVHQVEYIASLRSYCQYWRERLTRSNISTYCPVIRTNTHPTDPGPSKDYYLMSDALPEDRQLRQSLQLARLEAVLEQQQSERQDSEFKRSCLFCGLVVMGNRALLLRHMLESHGFSVGQPNNLVFVSEFLDLLQEKLDKLLCLYCEKLFKDRNTLKEHMRKKQHKKINPNNTEYDRFYVVNYQESGRGWREIMADEADDSTHPHRDE
ncbi:Zinc finger protein 277 [Geodia barretti]|nr:Zinc finger protein 277 [Geodia barretti]